MQRDRENLCTCFLEFLTVYRILHAVPGPSTYSPLGREYPLLAAILLMEEILHHLRSLQSYSRNSLDPYYLVLLFRPYSFFIWVWMGSGVPGSGGPESP